MSDQTRSLQDIYLSACKSFDDMADKMVTGYISAIESALIGYEEQEIQSKEAAKKAHEDREQDIQNNLKESIEVIENTIDITLSENRKFLDQICEELKLDCRKIQQEIIDLTDTLSRSHGLASTMKHSRLSTHCDASIDNTQQASSRVKQSLSEQAQASKKRFADTFANKQSQHFTNLVNSESQARREIPELLSEIIAETTDHESKLSNLSKSHVDQIERRFDKMRIRIAELSDEERERINTYSEATELRLRKSYDEMKNKLITENEVLTKDYHIDLEEWIKSKRSETSSHITELLAEMTQTIEQINQESKDKSTENSKRARQLAEELESLIEDQRLIAAQKSTVITQILSEMKDVELNFERNINKLASDNLLRLTEATDTTIKDIAESTSTVAEKINHLSDLYVKQIEDEEARILKIIERRLDKSIHLVIESAETNE